jgi:hypothetical protein
MVFGLTFVLLKVMPRRRRADLLSSFLMEATLEPLVSISFVLLLAILAFLAVFKVLIKDFFWMDIVGSLRVRVLSLFQTQ